MTEILAGSIVFTLIVLFLALVVIAVRAIVLPSRDVTVTVNGGRRLAAMTGQKLLAVLTDGGIPIPSACAGAGTCGLCRVGVPAGGGDVLPTEAARLSRHDIAEGLRLACQVVVRADMEVTVADDILNVETFACRIAETRMLSPLIREIVLAVPEGRDFTFRAGAFVQLTAPPYDLAYADIAMAPEFRDAWAKLGLAQLVAVGPKSTSRAYSIASAPAEHGRITLFIRLAVPPPRLPNVPPGIVSSYLFGLKPGDAIDVAGPYGTFRATDTNREMVLIGGGVGMAPLRSIVLDQLERLGTSRKISFWYGARGRLDLFREDEFEKLAARHRNFRWHVALSDPAPSDDWDGPVGFIHSVVYDNYLSAHPAPEDCEYYLCGPPLMVQAVLTMLDDCGVDESAIFVDDFGS